MPNRFLTIASLLMAWMPLSCSLFSGDVDHQDQDQRVSYVVIDGIRHELNAYAIQRADNTDVTKATKTLVTAAKAGVGNEDYLISLFLRGNESPGVQYLTPFWRPELMVAWDGLFWAVSGQLTISAVNEEWVIFNLDQAELFDSCMQPLALSELVVFAPIEKSGESLPNLPDIDPRGYLRAQIRDPDDVMVNYLGGAFAEVTTCNSTGHTCLMFQSNEECNTSWGASMLIDEGLTAGLYDMSQGGSDQRPLLSIFKINVFGSIEAQYSCNTGELVIDNDVSSEIGHILTGHIAQELDCCLYENNQYDCDQTVAIPSGEFMSLVVGDDFVP